MKFILTKTGEFDIPEEIISKVLAGEVFQEVDDKSINLMCEDQTAVNLETGEFWHWGEDENLHSGVRLLKAKMVIG